MIRLMGKSTGKKIRAENKKAEQEKIIKILKS
jgi:hypothetical protein